MTKEQLLKLRPCADGLADPEHIQTMTDQQQQDALLLERELRDIAGREKALYKQQTLMTPQDQIEALAELDGPPLFLIHKPIHDPFGYYRKDAKGYTNSIHEAWHVTEEVGRQYATSEHYKNEPDRVVLVPAPQKPYITSYDAIIPLLEKQERKLRCKVMALLYMDGATPAQLCEVLLRETGKWRSD